MKKWAIICFVKTPGLSPYKTRLNNILNSEQKLYLYNYLLNKSQSLLKDCSQSKFRPDIFWSVAEENGLRYPFFCTQGMMTLYQGSGDLAQRLMNTHSQLKKRYEIISFIGADCPYLKSEELIASYEKIQKYSWVWGPAMDGGFTYTTFRSKVPVNFWEGDIYSKSDTLEKLLERCSATVNINTTKLEDIDDKISFVNYLKFLLQKNINNDAEKDLLGKFKRYIEE
jgi:glycosyltransferase A (GT-A) superfamily protein (DUF2064 family)